MRMARKRGELLTQLPAVLHPEQRLTPTQSMRLWGSGKTRFYSDLNDGIIPEPERYGPRYVRFRAGDLLDAIARRAAAARAKAEAAAAAARAEAEAEAAAAAVGPGLGKAVASKHRRRRDRIVAAAGIRGTPTE
jgi:predicted DNA-binding transcriptional regulator AlpA